MEINIITSHSPEPALHSQRHRHQQHENQPQSVPGTSPTCIWRPHRTLGRHRNPSPSTHEIRSPCPTTLSTTITRTDALPALLFKKLNLSLPLPNLHTSTLDYHIRYATHAFKVDLQTDPLPDMTSQPPQNCERAFRNMMRKTISTLWRGQLYNAARTHAVQSPGQKASYI